MNTPQPYRAALIEDRLTALAEFSALLLEDMQAGRTPDPSTVELVCLWTLHAKTSLAIPKESQAEDTPQPYTDAQLLGAVDYVLSTGTELYRIHRHVNVGGFTGESVSEAAALWLDKNAERLVWRKERQAWVTKA